MDSSADSEVLTEETMTPYSADVELAMITFCRSLREKDRRRYAAVEAAKLGPGGVPYVARLLGIDSKTIRKGEADLNDLPDVPPEDVRKKGAAERRN
jgi:hypothetical protein